MFYVGCEKADKLRKNLPIYIFLIISNLIPGMMTLYHFVDFNIAFMTALWYYVVRNSCDNSAPFLAQVVHFLYLHDPM